MRPVAAIAILLLLAAPALAQERPPAERQVLLDLAYTLGQAHALRQACQGEGDQYWRDRMARLIDVEAAEQGFTSQLQGRFNAGYNTRQAQYPGCTTESRRALVATAAKGQALARKLAVVAHVIRGSLDPDGDAPAASGDTLH